MSITQEQVICHHVWPVCGFWWEFHFPNNTGMSKTICICIILMTTFCLHNYPLTVYYMLNSCQCQYLLKYNIYSYCNIWPNLHRTHVPISVRQLNACLFYSLRIKISITKLSWYAHWNGPECPPKLNRWFQMTVDLLTQPPKIWNRLYGFINQLVSNFRGTISETFQHLKQALSLNHSFKGAFCKMSSVMLLALKEDNTTGSFYLSCLLCMIIKSSVIFTSAHLYKVFMCKDGISIYVCPCMLLVSTCVICFWLHVQQLQYAYICGHLKVMGKFYIIVHVL